MDNTGNFSKKEMGERLKALRLSRKNGGKAWTKTKMATELQLQGHPCSSQTIANWENGETSPPTAALQTYTKIFGCTLDYLTGSSSAPNRDAKQERRYQKQKDETEMQEYMQQHRADLVRYAAELCDCSVSTYTVANEEIFDIHAEVCADCLGVKDLQGLQWLNYPCTAAEFDLLMGQVDRAIENVFKSFIEMKWQGVTVEEPKPIKEH